MKILAEDKTVTASDLISKIPSYTTDFKQQLCDCIMFAYESNFKNISNEDKLTDSELNSLYKKSVEYIELLTLRMVTEKQISKIDNSLDKIKEYKKIIENEK